MKDNLLFLFEALCAILGHIMRNFLQSLADYLWPVRPNVAAPRLDPNDCLRFLIVAAIVLLSGPEVFLAADMIAVLDLLGVVLFMTAFAVGYRMFGITILTSTKRILFPAEWTVLVKMRNYPSLVAYGLMRIVKNALPILVVSLCVIVNVFKFAKEML